MGSSSPTSQPGWSVPAWRFLVDENLPRSLAGDLRQRGHYAEDVRGSGLQGQPDSTVWKYAQANTLTIITQDTGFGNRRQYPNPHAGIVLVDIPNKFTIATRLQIILQAIAQLTQPGVLPQVGSGASTPQGKPPSLASRLVIIGPGQLRIV